MTKTQQFWLSIPNKIFPKGKAKIKKLQKKKINNCIFGGIGILIWECYVE